MPRNNRPRRTQPPRLATAWTEATRSPQDVEFRVEHDNAPTPYHWNSIQQEPATDGRGRVYVDVEHTGNESIRHGVYPSVEAAEAAVQLRQNISEYEELLDTAQSQAVPPLPAAVNPSWVIPRAMRVSSEGTRRHARIEAEIAQYTPQQQQAMILEGTLRAEDFVEAAPPRRAGLFSRGQVGINKSQIRDITQIRVVWDNLSANLRTRLNASLNTEGTLFRMTRGECDNVRNALAHGRVRGGLTPRLDGLLTAVQRWS